MGHRGGARRDPLGGEWFGKFLSVRKLPECDPQAEASLALVADAQSTVLGETDLKTSGLHLIDQVMLGVASAVVARRGTGIYLPAQHDSRWKTGLAQLQRCAHDLSRVAAGWGPSVPREPSPEGSAVHGRIDPCQADHRRLSTGSTPASLGASLGADMVCTSTSTVA